MSRRPITLVYFVVVIVVLALVGVAVHSAVHLRPSGVPSVPSVHTVVVVLGVGVVVVGVACEVLACYKRRRRKRSGATLMALPRRRLALLAFLAAVAGALVIASIAFRLAVTFTDADGSKPMRRYWRVWVTASEDNVVRYLLLIIWLVLLAYTFRWWRSAVHAGRPRSIEISVCRTQDKNVNGTQDLNVNEAQYQDELLAQEVEALVREELSLLRLFSASPLPGGSSQQAFFDSVGKAANAPPGLHLVSAMSVFLRGRYYRACCVIRADDPARSKPKGLTVEVTDPLGQAGEFTVRGKDWKEVASRTAHHIAAFVLPRTDLARKAPWTMWRGVQIDPALFWEFHEARRLSWEDRPEEALWHIDEAVKRDPLNPHLRIERAIVLEQLGLHIDALVAYVDVVTLESWWDGRLWRRYRVLIGDGWRSRPWFLGSPPAGHGALQLARYRMVCALAASQRLADQWHRHRKNGSNPPSAQPLRHAEAIRALHGLRPLLRMYATKMVEPAKIDLEIDDIEGKVEVLRRVLQYAALQEARALRKDYTWLRLRRYPGMLISQPVLRSMPIGAALQYRYVQIDQECNMGRRDELSGWFRQVSPQYSPVAPLRDWRTKLFMRRDFGKRILWPPGWPPSSRREVEWPPLRKGVVNEVKWRMGPWPRATRGWFENYSAACTFAVTLTTRELLDEKSAAEIEAAVGRHGELLKHAVNELERAVGGADSQFVSWQSSWIRSGDPDLSRVRPSEAYQTFIDRYLPDPTDLVPPPNIALLTISTRVVGIASRYAAVRAGYWREKADGKSVFTRAELAQETEWWTELRAYCLNYRHASTRRALILRAGRPAGPDVTDRPKWPEPSSYGPGPLQKEASYGPGPLQREADRVFSEICRSEVLETQADDIIRRRHELLGEIARGLDRGQHRFPFTTNVPVTIHATAVAKCPQDFADSMSKAWKALADLLDELPPTTWVVGPADAVWDLLYDAAELLEPVRFRQQRLPRQAGPTEAAARARAGDGAV